MRKTPALVVAAALLSTLTACTAQANCGAPYPSGTASELVSASGSVGNAPRVTFPTPLFTSSTEVSVLEDGEGQPLREGQVADLQLTLLHGETGTEITSSSYDESQPIRRTVGDPEDLFGSALECAKVGSRVVAATTVAEVYGADTLDPRLGLANEDTLIAVMDVQDAYLGRANGADQLGKPGFPAVVTAPDGTPGVTIPNSDAPDDLKIAVTKQGDGETVEEGDEVIVHYSGFVWESSAVFDSTWATKSPATLTAESIEDNPQSGLPAGFAEALIGQQVGSQIVAVVPPEYGYPEGAVPAIPAGSTIVMVFDILGIE
ncbi:MULTISPECIES: FKBP-type peptidyl-prolyl cis-trans isomerase [unclassified Diaminobutyricimonas]|uniref:FKBP-type peptidyl-prolyl cis-trans isomerase n=1 Tax=unclassified Diaminobutyricimonas TaxID=2643261 RepID=UPI0012F4A207|nr:MULTISPECIES: FKBP-type peptidyl-prolyl cis-trans isomerase [unclassified Diaminobutyricimonas]